MLDLEDHSAMASTGAPAAGFEEFLPLFPAWIGNKYSTLDKYLMFFKESVKELRAMNFGSKNKPATQALRKMKLAFAP